MIGQIGGVPWSAFTQAAHELLSDAAFCVTCGKAPPSIRVRREHDGLVVGFECHGKYERFTVPPEDIETMSPGAAMRLIESRSRVFLRSVARHGTLGQAGRLLRAARPVPRRQEMRQ